MKLPPDTRSALVMSPPDPGAGIILCRAPRVPSIETLRAAMRERGLIASITHDAGIAWPDAAGVAISENILDGDGVAVWEFDRVADALAAQRKLRALVGGAS